MSYLLHSSIAAGDASFGAATAAAEDDYCGTNSAAQPEPQPAAQYFANNYCFEVADRSPQKARDEPASAWRRLRPLGFRRSRISY